jgi:ABC-type uncharacterized transport system permease subunit
MAQQWGFIIAGAFLLLTVTAVLARSRDRGPGPLAGIILGAVCGLVAAFVIIQPRLDVVPDTLEPLGVAVVVVLVSLGLIMLTWRRGLRD